MGKVGIGVIGCGHIGRTHVERLANRIANAEVTGVSDFYTEAAKKVAGQYGCRVFETGEELINSKDVDAVLIASNDASHAGYVLESIKAGKRVFCEKPLATTPDECIQIMEAEKKAGKKLCQVGFMRRYDPGYIELKSFIDSGRAGVPLMLHERHRNMYQTGGDFKGEMAINAVCIHEIDISRWLTNDEYVSGQVIKVRQNTLTDGDYPNPLMVILKTKSGVLIDVEIQASGAYAYDIQCEVITEKASVRLPDPPSCSYRMNAEAGMTLMNDWSQRFPGAYDVELQAWTDAVQAGRDEGPSAWDGYVAAVTAATLIRSIYSENEEKIELIEKPAIYS
jgi:myo-inositol 2-dehydrogenase/D-chiro-inositol 1-dehydrogenase